MTIRWMVYSIFFFLATMSKPAQSSDICDILVFVPFSYNLTAGTDFFPGFESDYNNLGFSHMAAAALAVEHFNTRNALVVPQLGEFKECSVQLSIRGVYDTGTISHQAVRYLLQYLGQNQGKLPSALVGAYHDLPAQILGAAAAGAQIPLTTYRSYNLRSANPFYAPYTSLLYPDQTALAQVLVNFLRYQERSNHIALLYKLGDTSIQLQQVVSLMLTVEGMEHRNYVYRLPTDPAALMDEAPVDSGVTNLSTVAAQLKYDGFRTIVCIMEFPELEVNYIAQAAEEAGINAEEYFWVFVGIDLSVFSLTPVDIDSVNLRFLVGSAMITPLEGFQIDPGEDAFFQVWNSTINSTFISEVNSLPRNPQNASTPGYYEASKSYFQDFPPASGAGFMYDSIMTTGIGACLALSQGDDAVLSGYSHLQGIRTVNFTGATGGVSMGSHGHAAGRRHTSRAKYGAINVFGEFALAPEEEWRDMVINESFNPGGLYYISHTLDDDETGKSLQTRHWKELKPFIFRSGKTTPPPLLRAVPEQNYLSKASRITGLFLMSFVMFACIVSAIWLVVNREERIIKASQPSFMYAICFGSFVEALAILPVSFDESYGLTEEHLDIACMSVPWLIAVGHMITYGALFSKFRRRVVSMKYVAWPAMVLGWLAIAVLIAWTVVDPLHWDRIEINSLTGESIGRCQNDHFGAFLWPLVTLMLVPTIMTAIMAWKTNDVDSEFAESYWIFILIVVQIEVIVLGVPVVILLRDLSTTGRYWGVVLIVWIFPASAMMFLMVPKVMAHRRLQHPTKKKTRGRRSAGVSVSGLSNSGLASDGILSAPEGIKAAKGDFVTDTS